MTSTEEQDANRAYEILGIIIDRTRSGAVKWEPRADRPYAYELDLPSGNLEVGTADNDGAAPYDFRIYGPESMPGLKARVTTRERSEPRAERIEQLWKLINRAFSGVDATLDGLLRDLGVE